MINHTHIDATYQRAEWLNLKVARNVLLKCPCCCDTKQTVLLCYGWLGRLGSWICCVK